MYSALILLGAANLALLLLCLSVRHPKLRSAFGKILAVTLLLVGTSRLFFSDSFIYVINGGWFEDTYYETQDVLQLVLRWGLSLATTVLPMAVFCDSRFFKNLAASVVLPFSVASVFFYDDFMAYFLQPNVHGYTVDPLIRHILFTAELVLAISLPLFICIGERRFFRFGSFREFRKFIIGTPFAVLAMMPVYAPQVIFGYDLNKPDWFSVFHLLWLSGLLIVTLALYYLFRFRTYKERYHLLLFLTLVLFYHYHSMYLMGVTLSRLPFQLCNIATYFYLFAAVFGSKKMFHFCFLANMVGTIFAILLPTFSFGNLGFWNVHFLLQHTFVLIVPAVGMGLRIFPRVTLKSFIPYFVGFTSYFLFVFVLGTILNGDSEEIIVNYFYMFDHKLAFSYFPFLTFTAKYSFTVGSFTVYPLVVSIVYLGFSFLVFLFYLAVRLFYKLEDDHLALRRSGIELHEKLFRKPSRRPKHFID